MPGCLHCLALLFLCYGDAAGTINLKIQTGIAPENPVNAVAVMAI